MKKGLIGVLVLAVLVIGYVVLVGTNDNSDNMMSEASNEMTTDTMEKEEMSDHETMDKDDMTEKDEMEKDEMSKDEMSKDDMEKDDMTETDNMKMMNEGDMAPTFELMSLKGDTVSLEALKGEKVYVKFWASWCSICLSGLDELNELGMNEEIMVYTIVAPGHNGEKDKDDFMSWFESLDYDHIQVLFDETGDVQREYGVRGFPTSAYIGSDGVLIKTMPGHVSNEIILETFNNIY